MRASLSVGTVALIAAAVCAAAATSQSAPARGDRRAGESLAQHSCGACHIVAAHQDLAPLVPNTAPSFFAIAKRPGTTREALRAFLAHAHPYGRMPYPHLTTRQITDISAYILSMRAQP